MKCILGATAHVELPQFDDPEIARSHLFILKSGNGAFVNCQLLYLFMCVFPLSPLTFPVFDSFYMRQNVN